MNGEARPRPYRMRARADATRATGERILDAAIAAFWERPSAQISLEDVARRSGVTVQTVIRRFGGKERLLAAAGQRESGRIAAERDPSAVAGDLPAAVRQLLDHYERIGDKVLRMLAEEDRLPALKEIVNGGRATHREWCAQVFADALVGLPASDRSRRLAQLVALCDVYTWKLLRRDAGLSRRQTELALIELIQPLVEGD